VIYGSITGNIEVQFFNKIFVVFLDFTVFVVFFNLIDSIVPGCHPLGQGGSVWSSAPRVVVWVRPRFHPRDIMPEELLSGEVAFIHFGQFATCPISRGTQNQAMR
jgi:hypothetical protein